MDDARPLNNRRPLWWIIGGLAVFVIGGTGWLAWTRTSDAREFSQPATVKTYGGTNYVVQFTEVTVGKVASGCVVIVSARFSNPNPYPVRLHRKWFMIVDHDKDYYLPTITPQQPDEFVLPAGGELAKEPLTYVMPEDSLAGTLAIMAGHYHYLLIKSPKPMSEPLQPDRFLTLRRRDW
jgi:hypothetical protein